MCKNYFTRKNKKKFKLKNTIFFFFQRFSFIYIINILIFIK